MPLVPLKLPPGMLRNGTEFEQSNRWRDGSLMRWSEGSLRPVGGWSEFTDSNNYMNAAPRGMHGWRSNDASNNIAAGTYNKLYYISSSGTLVDITPATLAAGRETATQNTGYGGGYYNVGNYNEPTQPTATYEPATVWAIDNYGEFLIACSSFDGKLWEWQLDTNANAAAIANAPINNRSMIVTEERFIFALGAGGNPRKVQWCDREDNTAWTASATNEAGELELQTSGSIQCAGRVRGRTIILTDVDAHLATYQGPPYVYGFERVGSACGTDSPNSLVTVDQMAFWMGQKGFFVFDGSTVAELNCDVSDYIFRDINTNQISKVYGVHNSRYSEIWWFYPSEQSGENDRYITFDYKDKVWTFGILDRTAAIDIGTLRNPVWATPDGELYFHEFGFNHGGSTCFVESGPISLGNGDSIMKVNQLIPDEETQGEVTATFKTRFHPNDTERSYGAFTMTNPTSVRFQGRQVRVRYDSVVNSDFRVGSMRLNVEPGGRR